MSVMERHLIDLLEQHTATAAEAYRQTWLTWSGSPEVIERRRKIREWLDEAQHS